MGHRWFVVIEVLSQVSKARPGAPTVELIPGLGFLSEVGEDFQVGTGGFGDGFGAAGVDGGEVDEVAADSKRACTGLNETGCGFQSDAAGGDQLEERKRRKKRFEVAGAAHC